MLDKDEIESARRHSLLRLLPPDAKLRRQPRGYMTNCVFHEDPNPSLSLMKFPDGTWRYRCFGCGERGDPVQYVMKKEGMDFMTAVKSLSDLARTAPPRPHIVATYDYFDEQGTLLYQAVRYEPKDFRARRPNPDYDMSVPGSKPYIWDMCGVRRVLYRLPKLLMVPADTTIYYVEGEKDVETLERAGLVATTHAGGAGAFRDEYIKLLAKHRVVVVPDRDDAGMGLMRKVFAAHRAQGGDVGFLLLPNGKDATEYFEQGGTVKDFLKEVK